MRPQVQQQYLPQGGRLPNPEYLLTNFVCAILCIYIYKLRFAWYIYIYLTDTKRGSTGTYIQQVYDAYTRKHQRIRERTTRERILQHRWSSFSPPSHRRCRWRRQPRLPRPPPTLAREGLFRTKTAPVVTGPRCSCGRGAPLYRHAINACIIK